MNRATVYAKGKYIRVQPRKVAIVMDLVRGKDASEAARILKFDTTKAAREIGKVLHSAIANARHNLSLKEDTLFVSDIQVHEGPMRKKHNFAGRGRVRPILKRTSHIVVGLSERESN